MIRRSTSAEYYSYFWWWRFIGYADYIMKFSTKVDNNTFLYWTDDLSADSACWVPAAQTHTSHKRSTWLSIFFIRTVGIPRILIYFSSYKIILSLFELTFGQLTAHKNRKFLFCTLFLEDFRLFWWLLHDQYRYIVTENHIYI